MWLYINSFYVSDSQICLHQMTFYIDLKSMYNEIKRENVFSQALDRKFWLNFE